MGVTCKSYPRMIWEGLKDLAQTPGEKSTGPEAIPALVGSAGKETNNQMGDGCCCKKTGRCESSIGTWSWVEAEME